MPSGTPPPTPAPVTFDPIAGLLSYLVPGLGQLYQGRFSKGILFLVCVYGLFFYGMALGSWKNVYIPDTNGLNNPFTGMFAAIKGRTTIDLYNRPQFLGQFWIGVAAWPAIHQYRKFEPAPAEVPLRGFQRQPSEAEINELQKKADKTFDLAWVYTVIAGVLNVLVIYDALAGPALEVVDEPSPAPAQPQGAATV